MISSPILVATIASLLPASTLAAIYLGWTIPNVPSAGFQNISFPFDLSQAPHKEGWYFAQQFRFIGQDYVGFTGLQPLPDDNGQPIIRAIFSSFIPGTTVRDANCWDSAGGGPGAACSLEFPADYDHGYSLEVVNTGGSTTWTGTVVDTTTNKKLHVGTYTLPEGTQGIKSYEIGFVKYFEPEPDSEHCDELPYTSVTFGNPFTPTEEGSLGGAYEYPEDFCTGEQDFKFKSGLQLEAGFKTPTRSHRGVISYLFNQ